MSKGYKAFDVLNGTYLCEFMRAHTETVHKCVVIFVKCLYSIFIHTEATTDIYILFRSPLKPCCVVTVNVKGKDVPALNLLNTTL
jgi:hypothetical protein